MTRTGSGTGGSRSRSCRAPRKLHPPDAFKRFLGWYYTRIYIHIRPERVYVWRNADIATEPELFDSHMEEVRSGHSEEPERFHASPEGGVTTWDPRIQELGTQYATAVLSIVSPDGFPFSVRVPIHVDGANRWIQIDAVPETVPLQPGLACLTAHDHAPDFTWQHNFQVRGDLVAGRGRVGAAAAQADRRHGDPEEPARGDPRERQEGAPVSPHGQAGARQARTLMPAATDRLTVAITGPTGDIGRSLLRALDRSREVGRVVAMARRDRSIPPTWG